MKELKKAKDPSEKIRYFNARGLSKDSKKAAKQLIKTQKIYKKTTNRRTYQLIVSFPEEVKDANFVKLVAEEIADRLFERFQNFYGVHEDKKNLHIHFAINAVSYVDSLKWHMNKKELEIFKKEVVAIANEIWGEDKFQIAKNKKTTK